ncbi:FG-GAP repeat domain-containing protein [Deinococcus gobiensis]|uniref:FG-GAP repeat domain-containing protein n=1 Tax=Deinococcus gobiensis TaxID=502394 RepID=UPI00031E117A|nr:VCBS repeat-containing protein [Deinococcus gobiensis]
MAAPQIFTRPGAGVSNIPTQLTAFASPQFGEIADAVNVATGNVYVDLGSVNRNNQVTSGDDKVANSGSFRVGGLLRLNGFNTYNPAQPREWSLALGDGSQEIYERVSQNGTPAYCVDDATDLAYFVKKHTGTNTTEIHVINGSASYNNHLQQTGTVMGVEPNEQYFMADWDNDSRPDMIKIKPNVAGKTEVHIASGNSNYQQYIYNIATTLSGVDDTFEFNIADWNRDGRLDLIAVKKRNTGTNRVEIHVLDGAKNFQAYLLQTGTIMPTQPNSSTIRFADWDGDGLLDLFGIYKQNTGTGRMEVHIATSSDNFQKFSFEEGVARAYAGDNSDIYVFDWNKDGKPDVVDVLKNATGTQKIEVHVLNGAKSFQEHLLQTGTAAIMLPNDAVSFNPVNYPVQCNSTGADLNQAPTWISDRYSSIKSKVSFYRTKPQAGLQTDEKWLVTYQLNNGRTIAHHYDRSGNRTTFYNDGEYADHSQNLYQQYRTAKYQGDSDGIGDAAPKTSFSYTALNNGHLSKVKDEWGRVTTYQWNEQLNKLDSVSMLLQDESNPNSWKRRIEYAYEQRNGQYYVNYLVHRTFDGQNKQIGRWFSVSYVESNGQTVVSKIGRPRAQDQNDSSQGAFVFTDYIYDTQNRIVKVVTPGEKDMVYTYTTDSDFGGQKVKLEQGDKRTVFKYSPEGWLRRVEERDYNPYAEMTYDKTITTNYAYDSAGRIIVLGIPSGGEYHYTYDSRGNPSRETVYLSNHAWTSEKPSDYVRTTEYLYNKDNLLENTIQEARSGTSQHPWNADFKADYSYDEVTKPQARGYFAHQNGDQLFQVLKEWHDNLHVGKIWFKAGHYFYDEHGRLSSENQLAHGSDTLTTTYQYHGSDGMARQIFPDNSGDIDWSSEIGVRQYSDQVYISNTRKSTDELKDGRQTLYFYDYFNNVQWLYQQKAYTSKWNLREPSQSDREVFKSYDGFGQLSWEYVLSHSNESDYKGEGKKFWKYFTSGEVKYKFEGSHKNLETFEYNNNGLLAKSIKGSGDKGSITQARVTNTYEYDTYGRVSTQKMNDYSTNYFYDTSDNQAEIDLPDGTIKKRSFHPTGNLYYEKTTREGEETQHVYHDQDTLGREFRKLVNGGLTIDTIFDPFDNPIAILDDRLKNINPQLKDRVTYLKYDEIGRLRKRLSPSLVSSGDPYSDLRRPYVEYEYNWRNLLTSTKTLLDGKVDPNNIKLPENSSYKSESINYDVFDNPIELIDSAKYKTTTVFDNSNQPISITKDVWNTEEEDYNTVKNGFDKITSLMAYNASGKVTQLIDNANNSSYTDYNEAGLPILQSDARGIVTKAFTYTPDYLVEAVWEPDNDPDTTAKYGGVSYLNLRSTHKVTEFNSYSNNPNPTSRWVANMNTEAGLNSGALTSYTYDYAGRVLDTTLPEDADGKSAVIQQRYNSSGKTILTKDANGFITKFKYDFANNLTEKHDEARQYNQIDISSGLASGLKSKYYYNNNNNLIKKMSVV